MMERIQRLFIPTRLAKFNTQIPPIHIVKGAIAACLAEELQAAGLQLV